MRTARTALLAAALLVISACGASQQTATEPDSAAAGQDVPADHYPVHLDNCGTEISLDRPPERIVTIKSSTTELVLALGLGDRLAGTAFSDGPLPEDLAEAAADVPELAESDPSTEVVLATEPDLVFAGWESTFTDEGIGSRDSLAELGIATYVAPSACQGPGYQPDPLTFDGLFDHIAEAGDLLGAPDRAQELIETQQEQLAEITASEAGLSALWYSSGSDTPFIGGGIGAPHLLLETIGLTNIAADIDDTWASLSWEAVADAEPDVIVLVDSDWNTAEHKISVLESVPAMAALPAVAEGRYLVIPFPASEAGVRSVPAAADLADQLADVETTLP